MVVYVHEGINLLVFRIALVTLVCLSACNIPSLFAGEPEFLPSTQDYYHHFYQVSDNFGDKTKINADQVTIWNDNLIIIELGEDDLLPEKLFDLEGRTLKYTPEGPRFRVQSVPFQWDPDFGLALTAPPRFGRVRFGRDIPH